MRNWIIDRLKKKPIACSTSQKIGELYHLEDWLEDSWWLRECDPISFFVGSLFNLYRIHKFHSQRQLPIFH